MRELQRRGGGRRESGAFLLARRDKRPRRVVDFIPFDELDPDALNGAISIPAAAFGRLWDMCAERGLRVIADVHTHPSAGVAQSAIDRNNPMIAVAGHVAIIVPRFAQGQLRLHDMGVHVYGGNRTWESYYGEHAAALVQRRWW